MNPEHVINYFRQANALLEGHFLYTSGRHGRQFLQAARVLQYPDITEALCTALAAPFQAKGIELVVGPATGGIILAYETARQLNCRAAFTEKDGDEQALKRGFALKQGARVLVVEDIVTTGGSVRKTARHLLDRGADVEAIAVLIDRSGGKAEFDTPFISLAVLHMESWAPEDCPMCANKEPLVEPDDIVNLAH